MSLPHHEHKGFKDHSLYELRQVRDQLRRDFHQARPKSALSKALSIWFFQVDDHVKSLERLPAPMTNWLMGGQI